MTYQGGDIDSDKDKSPFHVFKN